LEICSRVLRVLRHERISNEELRMMLDRAVPLTNRPIRGFNRRYFHWLFKVDGEQILDMQRAEMVEFGHGDTRMIEEHENCRGQGCRACGWIGEIARRISVRDAE
jgi:hypothetical protein